MVCIVIGGHGQVTSSSAESRPRFSKGNATSEARFAPADLGRNIPKSGECGGDESENTTAAAQYQIALTILKIQKNVTFRNGLTGIRLGDGYWLSIDT